MKVPAGSPELDRILKERSNSTVATVRHFGYSHLEPPADEVGRLFHDVAVALVDVLPDSEALKFALEHLLVARNRAVDAAMESTGL